MGYAIALSVALTGLQACSSEDNLTNDDNPVLPTEAPVYKVSIPATIGDGAETRAVSFGADGSSITASFETTDRIYVYNVTKNSLAVDGDAETILQPTSAGTSSTLTGTLKFSTAPAVGDVLKLFYNMNNFSTENPGDCAFAYMWAANGSAENASTQDFAEASMKIKTISGDASSGYTLELCKVDDEASSVVNFQSLQSMFRMRLAFKDQNGDALATFPTITQLRIMMDYIDVDDHGPLCQRYFPISGFNGGSNQKNIWSPVTDANHDIYIPLRFSYSSVPATDYMTWIATDEDGKTYIARRAAPSGGFQNGKYYYGNLTLTEGAQPTVTGLTELSSFSGGTYTIADDNVTISGTSVGYKFDINTATVSTLTLQNLNATYYNSDAILSCGNNDGHTLTIVLAGNCTINQRFFAGAIELPTSEYLKLKTTGGTNTLTITCRKDDWDRKGIQAKNYVYFNSQDASNLAADGFSVTLTSSTTNGDGTWTYVYTVAPTAP